MCTFFSDRTLRSRGLKRIESSPNLIEKLIENSKLMGDYRPSSLVSFELSREIEIESVWGERCHAEKRKEFVCLRWRGCTTH
jgi:hypothetical protein